MLQRLFTLTLTLLTLVVLGACDAAPPVAAPGAICEVETFSVVDTFAGARRGHCTAVSAQHVRLEIAPEDDGYINNSPWYAFKVIPNAATTATITLQYVGGEHRYPPKISYDRLNWSVLDADSVTVSDDAGQATLTLTLGDEPFWVSAQELITPSVYASWYDSLPRAGPAEVSVLGESRRGKPIHLLRSSADATEVLFLVGRQHPPEVSSAIAFFSFYETLMADTDLAKRFRQRFAVVAIPALNPDGISRGHWRHNLGSTDLNRDWGPFTQPETRLVEALLSELEDDGRQIRVFLDFHSTDKNVFYTQNDDNPTHPPHFTRIWLDGSRPLIRDYEFGYEENPVDTVGIAKNYMYKRYGIPSSTYEVGDETDRDSARLAATVFAERLMHSMLTEL